MRTHGKHGGERLRQDLHRRDQSRGSIAAAKVGGHPIDHADPEIGRDLRLNADVTDHRQLPQHLLREMTRFFEDYKVLEHKQVMVEDILGPADALKYIREAIDLYQQLRRGELKSR